MNPQNKKMVVLGLIVAAAVLALAYFLVVNRAPTPSPTPTVEIPTPTVEVPTPTPETLPSGTPLGK